jgi:deazaflavin-dependent oxidoreductase (nitroreductase family)
VSSGLNPGLPDQSAERLRRAFKLLNRFMLAMWRLGMGRWINVWPGGIGRIMVLSHIGRRTGLQRQTPVNYARVEGEVYCISGYGSNSDWYRNIKADPHVEAWLPEGRWAAMAEELPIDDAGLPLVRQVLVASGFAAPLFEGIRPRTITDDQLRELAADYRLLHIRRLEAAAAED